MHVCFSKLCNSGDFLNSTEFAHTVFCFFKCLNVGWRSGRERLGCCCFGKVADSVCFSLNVKLAKDLLHPSPEEEKRRHKKKRLVQSPNSYFMDVKCPGTDVG
ncbi:UNVERIFIED_CONTAM: hypothetical protein FKN15_015747 [Acipenser sinensis]